MWWLLFLQMHAGNNEQYIYYSYKKTSVVNLTKKIDSFIPFIWMEFSRLKSTKPLRGDSLIFTTKSPGVPGNHFINLEGSLP